jgi:hypothetical protein
MDGGQGARPAMEPSDNQNGTLQHFQTKHLSIDIQDNDQVNITIYYVVDCGDDSCPMKGQPAVLYMKTCPHAPCS